MSPTPLKLPLKTVQEAVEEVVEEAVEEAAEEAEKMGLDESRLLIARLGIDDLGLTLGGLLDRLRKGEEENPENVQWKIEAGGWFDDQGSSKIVITGDFLITPGADMSPMTITLVPSGDTYFISEISLAGRKSTKFKDKVLILSLLMN